MRILLAEPPASGGWRIYSHPNLGVLHLSSYVKHKLGDATVLYLDQQVTPDDHLAQVVEFKPDIYGMSFSSLLIEEAQEIIQRVKECCPGTKVVCGGPHPSAAPEEVARFPEVDACVVGEGEETLVELIHHFLSGRQPLEDIQGIAFCRNGQAHVTPPRPLIKDLDSLPLPDWDLVDFSRFQGNSQYKAQPSTAMITSRGCPYDCNFCSNPVWKANKPWIRTRSSASVCEEIELLYGKGIRDIYIRSDEVNVSERWCVETFAAIKALGFTDLFFECNMRADNVTDELARLYAEMGGWLVYLGIESGCERTLSGVGKKVGLDDIVRTCRILKRHGIRVFGLFMIYHVWEDADGLQHETYQDVNEGTLKFIWRLRKEKLLDYISFTTTTPMPGSRLYDTALRYQLIDPTVPIKDLSDFSMKIPGVSLRQMKKTRLKGMLMQLWFVLLSGNTRWSDRSKLKTKLKYLFKSLAP